MKIIDLIEYDISNYKEASMFIITCKCSFKCDKENGTKICQNGNLAKSKVIEMDDADIVNRYVNNPLTSAIVFGGLEPFDQFLELYDLVKAFRALTEDTIVIYTGYSEDEISAKTQKLADFRNIIIKYGRFIPNQKKHFDHILGVELASDNQYAKVLKKLKVKLCSAKD
ncbi:MAG TPA: 4Fe-4S cluster-binding domain-containing protein [Bacteroidales bacterium]|nr:4Fe-4S cluster-binding domain-containing protein [Bacteroidales bacterium]